MKIRSHHSPSKLNKNSFIFLFFVEDPKFEEDKQKRKNIDFAQKNY